MSKTKEKLTNAQRFVNAYNAIDQTLRARHNIRRSLSFSDMIRRTVAVDYIVRKYEDVLIDYGRLRNAIIHKSNDKFLIAEPHEEVVAEFEKIADNKAILSIFSVFNLLTSFFLAVFWNTSANGNTLLLKVLPEKLLFSNGFVDVLFGLNGDAIRCVILAPIALISIG